jgi:hypothetical protein
VTTALIMGACPILWRLSKLTILKIIIILFVLDIALTLEAALYSDILLIAVLHIITIPALIGLIYFDLINQHKLQFKCFICEKQIKANEEIETVNRTIQGKPTAVIVHAACIHLETKERKGISSRVFRRGIPK